MSDLAPTYDARPEAGATSSGDRSGETDPGARTGSGDETGDTREEGARAAARALRSSGVETAPRQEARPSARPGQPEPSPAGPVPVRVSDPAGDLSRSVEGAPDSADIVAVELSRTGETIEVRTTFAGEVPTRQSGGKGMNVASFYDVDGNGVVDYEVRASLADNGWGTGHLDRREEKASYGPSTGIAVSVQARTLVASFPADRIGGAQRFRWSAASEWGSYEAMAASTSARDYAPDSGAVDYPG
jgi:hypothetical protein